MQDGIRFLSEFEVIMTARSSQLTCGTAVADGFSNGSFISDIHDIITSVLLADGEIPAKHCDLFYCSQRKKNRDMNTFFSLSLTLSLPRFPTSPLTFTLSKLFFDRRIFCPTPCMSLCFSVS